MKKSLFALSFLAGLFASCKAQDSIRVLSADEFERAVSKDTTAVVIDVRTPEEYAESHLQGARLMDVLDGKDFDAGIRRLDKSKTYYVYCRSGRRSRAAALKMKNVGLKVCDMKGGFLAWTEASKPVVKGTK